MTTETIKFKGRIRRDSEKALMADIGGAYVWLPRKLTTIHSEATGGKLNGIYEVPAWFAAKNGITANAEGPDPKATMNVVGANRKAAGRLNAARFAA